MNRFLTFVTEFINAPTEINPVVLIYLVIVLVGILTLTFATNTK